MMSRLVSPMQCLLATLLVISFQTQVCVKAFTTPSFIPLSSASSRRASSPAASISLGASSGMGMGASGSSKKGKKKKKSKSSSSNSSASSFDVNASLLRLEKKFEEMSSEASKAMMSDDNEGENADDMITADFVLAVRGTDTGKQSTAGTSDWVPVAQLALRPHVEVDSEFVAAAISCHCREIHHAATLGAPAFQSVPRNMVEYSVEPLTSWHKNVYDVIQEAASFTNADGTSDAMSKSKAKEILGISEVGEGADYVSSVKSAYRKKSFQLHPDRLVGKSESEIEEAQAEYELVKNAYDRLTAGGIRNASASWYESLGGRGRTDFRLVSLQGINAAKATMESNRVTCAIAGLDPELVQSFTTRNQAGASVTKSQQ